MKTQSFEILRAEIEEINLNLFKQLSRRQKVVEQIQVFKKNKESLWDPSRELKVFQQNMSHFKSLEDAFLFSVVMEVQAAKTGNYPKWSLGEHLNSKPQNIIEMTNPILIYIKYPKLFKQLSLRKEYRKSIMQLAKSKVVAIDGPSGSGKSTIAKLVAKRLGLTYLDTGAMFRAIAYFLNKKGISNTSDNEIVNALSCVHFNYAKTDEILVEVDSEDLTLKIREHEVSQLASKYSQNSNVRNYLKELQRSIALERPAILEGRDIGSVIFPNAALKIYLTANDSIRAERRYEQLKKLNPQLQSTVSQIKNDIITRDEQDKSRAIAPLVKADDAIEIDTSDMDINSVVERICREYHLREDLF